LAPSNLAPFFPLPVPPQFYRFTQCQQRIVAAAIQPHAGTVSPTLCHCQPTAIVTQDGVLRLAYTLITGIFAGNFACKDASLY
jgi:hypothetical protein